MRNQWERCDTAFESEICLTCVAHSLHILYSLTLHMCPRVNTCFDAVNSGYRFYSCQMKSSLDYTSRPTWSSPLGLVAGVLDQSNGTFVGMFDLPCYNITTGGSKKGRKSWRLKIFVLSSLEEQMSDLEICPFHATISASPLSSDFTQCTFIHTSVYHRKFIVLYFYFLNLPCLNAFQGLKMLFTRFIKCDTVYTICHSITINGLFNCSLIDRLLNCFNFIITFTNNSGLTILYLPLHLLKL